MPRRNDNARKGGNKRGKKGGGGWMNGATEGRFIKGGAHRSDRAPLTGGGMHSQTRRR